MSQIELSVKGMTCSHCASAVRKALLGHRGVSQVEVDIQTGLVKVSGNVTDPVKLCLTVTELGYSAAPVDKKVSDENS